jgi:hypothetical protein
LVAAENILELPQQRRSFLKLGCVLRTPRTPTTANAPEVETQEAEALASAQIRNCRPGPNVKDLTFWPTGSL